LRKILEKTLEYGVRTFHLFMDFKTAYGTIDREKLLKAVMDFKYHRS
jgi:hypothetical protein